jgi:hypothetical protein
MQHNQWNNRSTSTRRKAVVSIDGAELLLIATLLGNEWGISLFYNGQFLGYKEIKNLPTPKYVALELLKDIGVLE